MDIFYLIGLLVLGIALVIVCIKLAQTKKAHEEEVYWLKSILNTIPFPITVTDENMHWTFVNTAVEKMLNKKCEDIVGQHCSNWKSSICNTDQCGISCLKRGINVTDYYLGDKQYKVFGYYLHDQQGKKNGHIEFVQDVTDIAQSLDEQKRQKELIDTLKVSIENFLNISKQVAKSAVTASDESTEQFAIIKEFMDNIDCISKIIIDNIKEVEKTNETVNIVKQKASDGIVYVEKMNESMSNISQSSKRIIQIIKIIDDIASQTNLLALNAAIESARAGESGRGFAVVASEIRDLATKSSETVKDIEFIINESINSIIEGQEIARHTSDTLMDVMKGIELTTDVVNQLQVNTEHQKASLRELDSGNKNLSKTIEKSVESSQENVNISNKLAEEVEGLKRFI